MSETLKEVIARLKSQQNSQPLPKPVEPMPQPAQEKPDEEYIEETDELVEVPREKPIAVPVKPETKPIAIAKPEPQLDTRQEQLLMEMEMLQNNGRYRLELLHQLQEINKALVVIAGVLVDLSGNGQSTK